MSKPTSQARSSAPAPTQDVMAPATQSREWLVYRSHPNGGAVFAHAEEAIRADAINRALSESTTWGEFRSRFPRDSWESLEESLIGQFGYPDDDDEGNEDDPDRPKWDDIRAPFSPEMIPGFSDGDYPPWQQQSLDEILPADVLAQFAERKPSISNGSFWFISAERAGEVAEVLRHQGYQVEEAAFLCFF